MEKLIIIPEENNGAQRTKSIPGMAIGLFNAIWNRILRRNKDKAISVEEYLELKEELKQSGEYQSEIFSQQ